jgi:predicted ATPase
MMLIEEITIKNLLSFGPKGVAISLRPLNILIGPNGSGKSNFLDVVGFLRALPHDAWEPMRKGRSFDSWKHSTLAGDRGQSASLSVTSRLYQSDRPQVLIRHEIEIELAAHPSLPHESIKKLALSNSRDIDAPVFSSTEPSISVREAIVQDIFDPGQSVLSQPAMTSMISLLPLIAKNYESIRLYRDWHFGRSSPVRNPGSTAAMAESLDEDWSNFIPVLNEIQGVPALKRRLVEQLRDLYDELTDFYVQIAQDNMILWLYEGDRKVPASRLSDGTVRYMCLLAILLNPNPPPLVCIEEPELGLHPDLVVRVADLLKEASTRMQLVVTTHSDMLLDALSDTPESIVVCSKEDGETVMTRLDAEELEPYLKKQTLSSLWNSGQLGGRRW